MKHFCSVRERWRDGHVERSRDVEIDILDRYTSWGEYLLLPVFTLNLLSVMNGFLEIV